MKETNFDTTYLKGKGLPYNAIEERFVEIDRGEAVYEIIFEDNGEFWRTYYSVGVDCQSRTPWEYDDSVYCEKVKKVPVLQEILCPIEND